MEEIREKAFDDEFNKAEQCIEDRKRDKTPLPKHRKHRRVEDSDEGEVQQ